MTRHKVSIVKHDVLVITTDKETIIYKIDQKTGLLNKMQVV
jgi:hypothetical protein